MLLTFFALGVLACHGGLLCWLAVVFELRLDCKSRQVVYFLRTDLGLMERVCVV